MAENRPPNKKRKYTDAERRRRLRMLKKRRERERKIRILKIRIGICAVALLALIVILITGIRSCTSSKSRATDSANAAQNSEAGFSTESETAEAEVTPTVTPEPVSLTITVVGDCTLGTDENFDYDTSLNSYYEMYGSSYFMQNVRSVFAADDLTIANFEGTLTESEDRADKLYAFKAPASFAQILTDGDIETVNLANNHSHDYGDASFEDTKDALDAEGIVHFGYEETQVVDVKGVKVGLVGIYELNDHLEREQQLRDNIDLVKENGAELIIVIFHWGNEKEEMPDSNQTTLGRIAIDCGADLVCGHHPHVLQGIETYKGKNIVYSLGNFCFGGNSYPSDMDSMIYQQTFTITGGEVEADNDVNIIPCSISSEYYYNNYQPTLSEGSEADRILQKIQERSAYIPLADTDSYNYFSLQNN